VRDGEPSGRSRDRQSMPCPLSGEVLLDARLSNFGAELLDICGDGDRFDLFEAEAMVLAPVEEAFYRARVCHPRVAAAYRAELPRAAAQRLSSTYFIVYKERTQKSLPATLVRQVRAATGE
jgi:hypothetical protein